ncbi:hypothetical protein PTTW11_07692 [Pyrenophora teres f. teres]|uniref:Uncharacterized protein n=1 Tax=Pyrenophora teres f. teres TaxID=97479 RepID=A0A6S6WG58_9PLEO|nr:hypothetical protein PTTW11_07692 [Pyrenophora teres f. teres]
MSSAVPATDFPIIDTTSDSSGSPLANTLKKPRKIVQEDLGALQKAPQQQQQQQRQQQVYQDDDEDGFNDVPEPYVMPRRSGGRRMVPVHQSRIADRPAKVGEKDSSLKIKIELDLEVEVEIYARVKGDITIGLL